MVYRWLKSFIFGSTVMCVELATPAPTGPLENLVIRLNMLESSKTSRSTDNTKEKAFQKILDFEKDFPFLSNPSYSVDEKNRLKDRAATLGRNSEMSGKDKAHLLEIIQCFIEGDEYNQKWAFSMIRDIVAPFMMFKKEFLM